MKDPGAEFMERWISDLRDCHYSEESRQIASGESSSPSLTMFKCATVTSHKVCMSDSFSRGWARVGPKKDGEAWFGVMEVCMKARRTRLDPEELGSSKASKTHGGTAIQQGCDHSSNKASLTPER